MTDGTIVGAFDVASLALFAFFLFFAALIFWLRREDRREGYPLEDDVTGRVDTPGGPLHTASTKSFKLPFGKGTVTAPTVGRDSKDIAAKQRERFPGSPYSPTGNPLKDGIGPAAYAERSRFPDQTADGSPRIVPMAASHGISVADGSKNPIGMEVTGADGKVAGKVSELWVDQSEHIVRYLEVSTDRGNVLAPMAMATVCKGGVTIDAINAADFGDAPRPETPGQVTRYEEERIVGYFGGGYLYANQERQEPFV